MVARSLGWQSRTGAHEQRERRSRDPRGFATSTSTGRAADYVPRERDHEIHLRPTMEKTQKRPSASSRSRCSCGCSRPTSWRPSGGRGVKLLRQWSGAAAVAVGDIDRGLGDRVRAWREENRGQVQGAIHAAPGGVVSEGVRDSRLRNA